MKKYVITVRINTFTINLLIHLSIRSPLITGLFIAFMRCSELYEKMAEVILSAAFLSQSLLRNYVLKAGNTRDAARTHKNLA